MCVYISCRVQFNESKKMNQFIIKLYNVIHLQYIIYYLYAYIDVYIWFSYLIKKYPKLTCTFRKNPKFIKKRFII